MLRASANPKQSAATHPALFACMLGMVLANLLFVRLTGIVSPTWLAVLFTLTLAAPLLARFKDKLWYRALWNAGLIAFFSVLLRHAMSRNLEFVLQDGLTLAALCQVHLLNNLRAAQRPDLLFLNSFLIAIITGYITVDLGFAGAFLLYAPFFVMGMQFQSVLRPGQDVSRAEVRAITIDGARRSALLLAMTLLAFLFVPRDFQRQAMFGEYFDLTTDSGDTSIGFSESLTLKKHDSVDREERVVLTVHPTSGEAGDVPEFWRGATLPVQGPADQWEGLPNSARLAWNSPGGRWRKRRGGLTRRGIGEPRGKKELEVVRFDPSTRRLFLPDSAQSVFLDKRHSQGDLRGDADGTMRYTNPGQLYYTVQLALESDGERKPTKAPRENLATFLKMAPSAASQSAIDLARSLRAQLPKESEPTQVVAHFSEHLQSHYPYRLPGDSEAAESLDQFLTSDAGGHCEFFASALTTMLRSERVPCRVVTGYRSARWDAATQTRVFLNLDAHAWVEVLDPILGWYAVDPTPAGQAAEAEPGLWAEMEAGLKSIWLSVTGFDGAARGYAVDWLQAAPGRLLRFLQTTPIYPIGTATVLAALLVLRRIKRKRQTPQAVRALRAALDRAHVQTDSSQTPREILAGIEPEGINPQQRAQLEEAVERHERARYAG